MAAVTNNTRNTKKVAVLVAVTILTLVLGGIAVVTALRLRQLATEPVAPTAPESRPLAQTDPGQLLSGGVCEVGFSVEESGCMGWCDADGDCGAGYYCEIGESKCYADTEDCDYTEQDEVCECPTAEVGCQQKDVYLDSDDYTAGTFDLESMKLLSEGDNVSEVSPGDILVYAVTLRSTLVNGAAVMTDELTDEVKLLEVDDNCEKTDASTVTCDYDGELPVTLAYRVEVNADVAKETEFVNKVYLGDELTICEATLKTPDVTPTPTIPVTPSPTPTGTPGATATPGPTTTPGPTSTPRATSTPKPTTVTTPAVGCNDTCVSNSDCTGSLICYNSTCRNSSCTAETDCVCPPVLPEAGSVLPAASLIMLGGLLMLAGLAGWLVW